MHGSVKRTQGGNEEALVRTIVLVDAIALIANGSAFIIRLGDILKRLRRRGGQTILRTRYSIN